MTTEMLPNETPRQYYHRLHAACLGELNDLTVSLQEHRCEADRTGEYAGLSITDIRNLYVGLKHLSL